ncbi:unnamed protein product [Phytomonas sp. EM1]|nr:unnamed protein product [Phytomonas sp. EM1]|eukprot:CCW65322.1 unnamed protein product [Phytomonas sp. isolate EM1]
MPSPKVSSSAVLKEQELESDFFKLLRIICEKHTSSKVDIGVSDWKLTENCLDEINYRYADFYFLVAFASTYPFRNKCSRSFFARNRLPLYFGLVGYDIGLRSTSPYPAISFWNSICVINSDMGRAARMIRCPDSFYEVVWDENHTIRNQNFMVWVSEKLRPVICPLLLQDVFTSVFEASSWKEERNDGIIVTSLVINNRFFRWDPFKILTTTKSGKIIYQVQLALSPSFGVSRNMRRSYHCRDIIMERSTLAGRVWYGAHFLIMYMFGLERP